MLKKEKRVCKKNNQGVRMDKTRNEKIVAMREESGATLDKIGKEFGISKERVRQILLFCAGKRKNRKPTE